jgi:hypothetical protein
VFVLAVPCCIDTYTGLYCKMMMMMIIVIIIIIFIDRNWVVSRWQWLFYMYTKYEIGYK